MEVISQNDKLDINNIDHLTPDSFNHTVSKHGTLFPDTIRCIISGPSNCGKTNVVFNLITKPNGLSFNNIYLFSKSLNQPKYLLLERILNDVPEVSYNKFDANSEIMEPNNAKPHSIFIFDDVSCENHCKIRTYFAMGRHNQIDSIYIGQTYSKIPKQLIRDNVNFLIAFKQDEKNLRHIYNDHVGADMSFEKFREVCGKAWNEKYGFIVIDKDRPTNNGRYRIGFDRFVIIH